MSKVDIDSKYDYLLSIMTDKVMIDGKYTNLKEDYKKFFIHGNKTAGKRVRKIMQIIRKTAEEIRRDVQDYKKNL